MSDFKQVFGSNDWLSFVERNRLKLEGRWSPLTALYSFVVDTEEGAGVVGYMLNASADGFDDVRRLAAMISLPAFSDWLERAAGKFPDNVVPADRDDRIDVLNAISNDLEFDPFEGLERELPSIRRAMNSQVESWMMQHSVVLLDAVA